MNDKTIIGTGKCLCGVISIQANTMKTKIGACHCDMCRNWGGGPFMAVDCGTDVQFNADDNIAIYNSSAWAERGFCKQCGSHLFYRLKESQQYIMPVGLFEAVDEFVFDHQLFIDKKPAYYCFSNKTRNMTGEEVFAHYAPATE